MHTLLLVAPLILAQVPPPKVKIDTEVRARTIAPFLDSATLAVARVDMTRLDVDALVKELATMAPVQLKEFGPEQRTARAWVERFTQAGGKELYVVVSLADLPGAPFFVVAPLPAGADGKALTALLGEGPPPLEAAAPIGNAVVAGQKRTLERLRILKPDNRPELAKAFALAGDATAQVLLLPPAHARRLLEETYPTLPRELGGGPITALTRGFLWGAVTVEIKPQPALRAVIQAQDAKSAQALADLRRSLLSTLLESALGGDLPLKTVLLADPLKPKVVGDQLLVSLDGDQIRTVVAPLVQQALAAADRNRQANNLKQIGLALHNYHDHHGSLPAAASFDKQGKPLLSWRVHLLPFLEQDNLYKQFRLDEPWDSKHNVKLIAQMPEVYRGPASRAGTGKTNYLVPVGPPAIFTGGPKGTKMIDIEDGTSNTIMVVEVDDEHAAFWTKPDDWKSDPMKPLKGLREHSSKVFTALFADGSVRFLPTGIDPKTLRALFTRSGGEAVQVP